MRLHYYNQLNQTIQQNLTLALNKTYTIWQKKVLQSCSAFSVKCWDCQSHFRIMFCQNRFLHEISDENNASSVNSGSKSKPKKPNLVAKLSEFAMFAVVVNNREVFYVSSHRQYINTSHYFLQVRNYKCIKEPEMWNGYDSFRNIIQSTKFFMLKYWLIFF